VGLLADTYKDSKRYQREAAELRARKVKRAVAVEKFGKPDPLKTVGAQTRFRNEEATATDEDMNRYYPSTPSARRP
jgi:hypothetical protein